MELIHVDSPVSPLYPGNISYEVEIQRLIDRSNARAQYLHATLASLGNNNVSQTIINPLDIIRNSNFTLSAITLYKFGIGAFDATFPARPIKTYYFCTSTLEAASYGCCVRIHPFCKPNVCVGAYCSQHVEYMGGPAVHSILSVENFNLLSSSGQPQPVPGVVFVCAYDTRRMTFGRQEDFKIAGLLIWYRHPHTTRLSACQEISAFQRSTILLRESVGISVHGQKLLIDPLVFAIRNQGTAGGCIMDNGTSFTFLITPAFKALVQFLEMYFMHYPRLAWAPGPRAPSFELCYKWTTPPPVEVQLPTLTFHFENADLEVQPSEAFITAKVDSQGNEALCLAFLRDDERTFFGSFQQSNYRFVYDLNR
ncbi:hypothetical protein L3X38_045279 [Prunus dulcis]|uniref:Xylanase inhibitor C-terminal domain-containing protein n=1 Tax=Prunus dulcis TaxID=3755 RepID=A0AAD4YPR9_PRUDU|nr:hypothetical protein L3X38_045279 [Prunus dulcis]